MSIELESKLEGLLFYKGDEVKIKELSKILNISKEQVEDSLKKLDQNLDSRGIILVRKGDSVVLGVNPELSETIESIRRDELDKDLSKASLETLSIILYKEGISRSEIDYIRGVNSSFILRNLLVRGLIEKSVDKKDSRKIIYSPTFDTLSFMGINKIEELPNYHEVIDKLEETLKKAEENE